MKNMQLRPTLNRLIIFLALFLVIPVPITVFSADNGEGFASAHVWGSVIATPYVQFITPIIYVLLILVSYVIATLITWKSRPKSSTVDETVKPVKAAEKTTRKKKSR